MAKHKRRAHSDFDKLSDRLRSGRQAAFFKRITWGQMSLPDRLTQQVDALSKGAWQFEH